MAKIANVQEVSPSSLIFYQGNAKIHSEDQVDALIRSIEEFGFLTPCLIDHDRNLIAGHGRVMAALKLGLETVPCVEIEGLTDAQRRAYILADNRLAEMAEWNMELLSKELQDLEIEGIDIGIVGFSREDIIEDLSGLEFDNFEFEAEPQKEPESKTGQIWSLGEHRLMCGDSTKESDIRKLVGEEQIDLLLTDPPYNVDITGNTKNQLKIKNDSMSDGAFYEFLYKAFQNADRVMRPGAAFYIWHASPTQTIFEKAIQDTGDLRVHQQIIWVKDQGILGRADYQWMHEPCFYGWKEGAAHYFVPSRRETTVWEDEGTKLSTLKKQELIELCEKLLGKTQDATVVRFHKPTTSAEHPTMKPVELIAWQMRNSTTKGQAVLDFFGGGREHTDRRGGTRTAVLHNGTRPDLLRCDPEAMGKHDRREGGAA